MVPGFSVYARRDWDRHDILAVDSWLIACRAGQGNLAQIRVGATICSDRYHGDTTSRNGPTSGPFARFRHAMHRNNIPSGMRGISTQASRRLPLGLGEEKGAALNGTSAFVARTYDDGEV